MGQAAATDARAKVAIVGIGYTQLSRRSGRSPLDLAVEAITEAVEDAGLSTVDIDGLATHHVNDSAPVHEVAVALGLPDLSWYQEEFGGGSRAPAVVGQAALACHHGAARTVVVYRALNGRSGMRMGASGGGRAVPGADLQFQEPYGLLAPAHHYGLGARMHMNRYGTTYEHLGMVAVQQRRNAAGNPRALMRKPLTMEDYLNSRWIADPFRLLDCCLETDGACAVVLTATDRAADLRQPVVALLGWASSIGPNGFSNTDGDLTHTAAALLAPRLYSMAGVGPADVDVAEIYDAFTYSVLVQLEDYGFCAKGEGGPFVASGATALGGALPVNTHGGFLSEGYVHGLNHVCEAVSQLRGHAGSRQAHDAEVALSTAQPGYISGSSSALLLGRA